MIKRFWLLVIVIISLSSCATKWSTAEQNNFLKNCKSASPNTENIDDICKCGLQKAMDSFNTYDSAKKAISQMQVEEWEELFGDCN